MVKQLQQKADSKKRKEKEASKLTDGGKDKKYKSGSFFKDFQDVSKADHSKREAKRENKREAKAQEKARRK